MPPDIRNFFAPKPGSTPAKTPAKATSTPQEKPTPKATPKPKAKPATTPATARKAAARKRVIDSDDDDDEEEDVPPPTKKPTATLKKPAAAPKKPAAAATKKPVVVVTPKSEKVESSAYFSAAGKSRVSRTVEARPSKPVSRVVLDDDDSGDDIYAEAFQKRDDDYKEEPMDDFVVVDDDEDVKPKKRAPVPSKTPSTTSTRKRKPEPIDDEEEEEEEPKKKAKPMPRKRAPPKKMVEEHDNSEVQKLLDSVPTVRAPTPPPRDETKKFSFRDAVTRAGPVSEGSKVVPTGADNCLAGLTFVFTGVLESLSREDGQQLVKRYGGKVTGAPSRKTSFVVLGSDAGPKKLETIRTLGTKTINEDGLFHLIKTLPPNGGDGKAAKDWEAKKQAEEKKIREAAAEMEKSAKADAKAAKANGTVSQDLSQLWTTKYAPSKMNEICGNKGQVEKLQKWLKGWPNALKTNFQLRGAEGLGGHRAVMIHGPPGIGKTTAAHLVANLEGYDVLEYNASDTRSKKLMEETMRGILDNTSLLGYFAGDKKKVDMSKKKIVLIMDEVDGMSAGDRGGVGQLAAFCRKTSVPIICICNERKLPKMKPFDHVTLDLAFRRPEAAAIRSRIASVAFREGMKLPPNVIDALVEGTRSDIRQIINMLSTYKTTASNMSFDQSKDLTKSWEKHIALKPWDIAKMLLGHDMFGPNSGKTLNDKMELYFNDHEFSYLMVQENYLKSMPKRASGYAGREARLKTLELMDNAASSISDGDLADTLIHGNQQHWSLMPVHGMLSTVIPASNIYGSLTSQITFTSWLGNNSKHGKLMRFVKEIQSHIRLRASGDRHEVRQSYIPYFFETLVRKLQNGNKDSLADIIECMDDYFLTREDWDAIIELGVGPNAEESVKIPSLLRSAFTRTYNQMSHPMPFMKASSVTATKAAKKEVPDIEDAFVESEDELVGAAEDELKAEADEADISKDKYIKAPKKKPAPRKAKAKAGGGDEEKAPKAAAARGKAAAGRGGAKAARGKK